MNTFLKPYIFGVFSALASGTALWFALPAILLPIFSTNTNSADSSTVSIVPGMYTVKTEIIMPHLIESLRYATTNTTSCLGHQDPFELFPILGQASFIGCSLVERPDSRQLEFDLVCSNLTAASGLARFIIGKNFFNASLDVKMGGKNMKFTQKVTGQMTGPCKQAE